MKILIAADMEGISGVVNWDQVDSKHPEYNRFRQVMTEEVNAAVRGVLAGGAEEVLVADGHGGGYNILLEKLDPRAKLNAGNPAPFAMLSGIETGVEGAIFVGYHARAGTQNAICDHTWSSARVANLWLNQILVGETGLNAALCGYFHAPVLAVCGDQAVCNEAVELLGPIDTVAVKRATSRFSAECLPPEVSHAKIQEAAEKAVRKLKKSLVHHLAKEAHTPFHPQPFSLVEPVRVTIDFHHADMADRASLLPGASRTGGRQIEFTAADMRLAYLSFRAAVNLA
jgi:D-amino peptidase